MGQWPVWGCDVMDVGGGPARPRVKSPTEMPTEARQARRKTILRQTILLMLALLLVGAAGLTALMLLHRAMRTPNADDTAALICTAYKTQNYDALISRVDGKTPDAQGATSAFDAAAQNKLKNTLTSADRQFGKVKACSYKEQVETISPSADQKQYLVVIQRTAQPLESTLFVFLVRESDGGWHIARKSDFGMPQTGG